jgi:hypothetical protein
VPLFLRSLPLSVTTLWHYVFLSPLVLIVCIPFLLLTILPLVGWIVSSAILTFISFAGFRCAITALGHGNQPSFGKLVRSSLLLGVINSLAGVLFLFLAWTVATGLERLGIVPDMAVPGLQIPYVTGFAAVLYLTFAALFYCAMAVPMTALAAAATERGRDPGPFWGFGRGLFNLVIVWGLWLAGFFYLGFFVSLVEGVAVGVETAVNRALGLPAGEEIDVNWWFFGLSVIYFLWGTCWFCATAALAWDRVQQRAATGRVVEVEVARVSAEDLRSLREARMRVSDRSD